MTFLYDLAHILAVTGLSWWSSQVGYPPFPCILLCWLLLGKSSLSQLLNIMRVQASASSLILYTLPRAYTQTTNTLYPVGNVFRFCHGVLTDEEVLPATMQCTFAHKCLWNSNSCRSSLLNLFPPISLFPSITHIHLQGFLLYLTCTQTFLSF